MSKRHKSSSETVASNTLEQAAEPSGLEDAADDIKLAVDLIYLLENNEIETEVALSAIEIVRADLMSKLGKHAS